MFPFDTTATEVFPHLAPDEVEAKLMRETPLMCRAR